MAREDVAPRTLTRYNPFGARCGERIPLDDYHFAAFQAGQLSEPDLRRRLALQEKPPLVRSFWNNYIDFEKDQTNHGSA